MRRLQAMPAPDTTGGEEDWRDRAACREAADPEIFFQLSVNPLTLRALSYCARCEVTGECSALADDLRAQGVWGGEYRPVTR